MYPQVYNFEVHMYSSIRSHSRKNHKQFELAKIRIPNISQARFFSRSSHFPNLRNTRIYFRINTRRDATRHISIDTYEHARWDTWRFGGACIP